MPLFGRLLCIANYIQGSKPSAFLWHAAVQESIGPTSKADVLGKYSSLAVSMIKHAHRLMELAAMSMVSQEAGRQHEEDSRMAEARLSAPLQLCNLAFTPAPSYRCDSDCVLLGHHEHRSLLLWHDDHIGLCLG